MERDILQQVDDFDVASSFECLPSECASIIGDQNKHLKIITQNIRSIYKNLDTFLVLLSTLSPLECDILILTECWLSRDKPVPSLLNYNLCHSTSFSNQNDGIVVFSKPTLSCVISEPLFDEATCLLIQISNHTAIVAIYRSPSHQSLDKFTQSLETVLQSIKSFRNCIIMGDMNIDIKPNNIDPMSVDYLNLTSEFGFLPANVFPTRYGNCLDHALIKTKNTALSFVIQSAITDHLPVLLCLSLNASLLNQHKSSYSRVNFEITMKSLLNNTTLKEILQMSDANNAANSLVDVLRIAIDLGTIHRLIPLRQRIHKPWITMGLLRCIRHRDNMHTKVKKNPNNLILSKTYRRYRNFCNSLLKKLKIAYEKSELEKAAGNPKKTWKVIKKITNINHNKSSSCELLQLEPNPYNAINSVNAYFSTVGKSLAENISEKVDIAKITSDIKTQTHSRSFALLDVDQIEVEQTILSLKSDSAPGWDGISSRVLKLAKNIIVQPLTHVVNLCFNSGIFPDAFKKSVIIPIHKSGVRDSVSNYRPISILPALSKVIEKLLNKRLMSYLESEHILSDAQYGFRRNKSTEKAVTDLTDFIVRNIDQGKKCIALFLDMAKAFDTVSIPLLLGKLQNIGVRGTPLKLFRSYLSDRTQRVSIGKLTSDDEIISYGVPQGSILGPTLFLIFINELCRFTPPNGKIFTFADDTALVFESNTWDQAKSYAELGLHNVISWLDQNLLTLNLQKSKFIAFSILKKNVPSLQIKAHTCHKVSKTAQCDCVTLEQVQFVKYLGVLLDSQLSWIPQIDSVTARTRKLIWIFKNLRHVANFNLLKTVYFALGQSMLSYCISVWGGAYKTHLIRAERAQRSILKVLSFKPFRYPTSSLYNECKLLSIRKLFILHSIIFYHQTLIYDPTCKITSRRSYRGSLTQCNTSFARQQGYFMKPYIYKNVNKLLHFYPVTLFKCKGIVKEWLLLQDYDTVEHLLAALI